MMDMGDRHERLIYLLNFFQIKIVFLLTNRRHNDCPLKFIETPKLTKSSHVAYSKRTLCNLPYWFESFKDGIPILTFIISKGIFPCIGEIHKAPRSFPKLEKSLFIFKNKVLLITSMWVGGSGDSRLPYCQKF